MKTIQDLAQTLSSSVRFHLERHRSGTYWCSTSHFEGMLCSECEGAGAVHKYNCISCAPHTYTRSFLFDYRVLGVSLRS